MKDFKKMLKLTWKWYAIWIILVGFFFALSNVFVVKSNLRCDSNNISDIIKEMGTYLGKKKTQLTDQKIDEKYLKEAEKTAQDFADKYKLNYRGDRFYDETYYDKINSDNL